MQLPRADHVVVLPDRDTAGGATEGRRIGYDDRGDPSGPVVLFLHGTPDTRLARHPDDAIATRAGLRVIAPDRPGLGDSDPDPAATPTSVAADHLALLDLLDIDTAHVVAWSAGALFAIAVAGRAPTRVRSLQLVAPLVPADAYVDPAVIEGANDGRRMFADVVDTMEPTAIGAELAPWLVPAPIDDTLAREILTDSIAAVADIPGADAALVAALRGSVVQGMAGMEAEIAAQATPLREALVAVRQADIPARIHVGATDEVCPPPMGRWYADQLGAVVVGHNGGHEIGITAWEAVLTTAAEIDRAALA